jgi:hypothetical protein
LVLRFVDEDLVTGERADADEDASAGAGVVFYDLLTMCPKTEDIEGFDIPLY